MRKIIYDYCYLCDGRGPLEKEKAALLPHSMFCRKIKFCSFQFDWVLCLRIGDTQDQHSSIWLQLSKCMIFMRLILQRLNLTSTTLQLEMRNVSNLMLQLNTFNLVRAIWCIWCFVKLCIRKFWHLDDVRSSKKNCYTRRRIENSEEVGLVDTSLTLSSSPLPLCHLVGIKSQVIYL